MSSELDFILNELAQYTIFGNQERKSQYQKEEIKLTEKDKTDREIYNKFNQIKRNNFWREEEETFYKQAILLENYNCDCKYTVMHRDSYNPYRYCCTYAGFSFRDFKTYFSWRSKIRKGDFEKPEFEYEQVYINELLNKIGCKDADDAIEKLISFWKQYRKYSLQIDEEMPNIIKEFYIINEVKEKYEDIVKKYPIQIKSISKDLKDINKGIYINKIEFFNEISSYKILKSKFLETKYANALDECIERIFTRLHKELEEKSISLPNMLIYKGPTDHWWEPLYEYKIYEKPKEKVIILEGTEKYEYKYGRWGRTKYIAQTNFKNTIGYILKTMECYIREYLGYRKLKAPSKEDILIDYNYWYGKEREIITNIYKMNLETMIKFEVIKYLSSQQIPRDALLKKKKDEYVEPEEKIEIKFNKEEFEKIREKSEEIQKALIVEEEQEIKQVAESFEPKQKIINEQLKPIQTTTNEVKMPDQTTINEESKRLQTIPNEKTNVFKEFTYNLTEPEKEILQVLLQKENVESKMFQIAQNQNEMLEVMVSNINDKALETIGDTIIESDMASIYEDYENEIKQVL